MSRCCRPLPRRAVPGRPIKDGFFRSIQDRDSGLDPKSPTLVILELLEKAPTVKKLFADSAYAGPKLAGKLKALGLSELLEIVTKPEGKTRRVRL